MSCWFVFKNNDKIFALLGGFHMKEIVLACSRCKLLPPSVHRAVCTSCHMLVKGAGGRKAFVLLGKR